MNQPGKANASLVSSSQSSAGDIFSHPLKLVLLATGLLILFAGGIIGNFLLNKYDPTGRLVFFSSPQPVAHYQGVSSIKLMPVGDMDINVSGKATRRVTASTIYHAITASLPQLSPGMTYQVWIANKNDRAFLGNLIRKSGREYILYSSFELDPSQPSFSLFEEMYNTVIISKTAVKDPDFEEKVLEGEFTP